MAFNPATTPRSNARGGDRCIIGTAPRWPTRAHGARGACMGTDASMMQTAHSSGKVRSDAHIQTSSWDACVGPTHGSGLSHGAGHRKRHTDVQGLRMHACGGLVRRILRAGAPAPAVLGPVSGRHVSTRRVVRLSECTRESRGQCAVNAREQAQWRHPFTEIHSFGWQRCVLSCPPEREASRLS